MKKTFPGYFSNDADILKDVWGRCLFVLDANVLLSLYRYSNETRSELFEIFKLLGARLWVPHQVASEYLVNRVGVIGQQVKVYDDAVKNVEELRRAFENPKQHPFVQDETLKQAVASFEKVIHDLNENKRIYLQKIEVDDVKAELEVLLDGRVGAALTSEEVADVLVVGQARYLQRTPPGYKDSKKGGDSEIIADKLKPFGDYIVWRQTLSKARDEGLPVVFVTGDSKEDWWTIYSGKPIEPHPQLVDEFVKEVGQNFYMYLPEKFMERSNEYLNRVTSQSAVDEIVDVRAEELSEGLVSQEVDVNSYIFKSGFKVELQPLLVERDMLESKMSSALPQMELIESKIELIEFNRLEVVSRYNVSLKASNGEETIHSSKLKNDVQDFDSQLQSMRAELVSMKRNYMRLAGRLSEVKWEMESIIHYKSSPPPPRAV